MDKDPTRDFVLETSFVKIFRFFSACLKAVTYLPGSKTFNVSFYSYGEDDFFWEQFGIGNRTRDRGDIVAILYSNLPLSL